MEQEIRKRMNLQDKPEYKIQSFNDLENDPRYCADITFNLTEYLCMLSFIDQKLAEIEPLKHSHPDGYAMSKPFFDKFREKISDKIKEIHNRK